jgi:hypothetical protein
LIGSASTIQQKKRACEEAGITTYVPNSSTSPNKAKGKFDRSVFR